jgi:hypothetical protein
MPVTMDRNEIEFLLNNQDKIEQLIQMEDKLNAYINQKANAISNEIKVGDGYKKWVYAGNDPGFHYTYKDLQFKLECPISKEGISIVICVEQNKADRENLKRLDLFKKRGIDNYENNSDNSRVVLEQLDFFTPTDVLVEKLKDYLSDLKITEANEQLN